MDTLLQKIYNELFYHKKVESQSDFGDKLGYHKAYMSNAMQKKDIPSKMQNKLHEVFGISKVWLATEGKEGSMFVADSKATEKPTHDHKAPQNKSGEGYMLYLMFANADASIADIADKLERSRRWLYDQFEKTEIEEEVIHYIEWKLNLQNLKELLQGNEIRVSQSGNKEVIILGKSAPSRLAPGQYGEGNYIRVGTRIK